jgi:hypothetical protein
LPITITIKKKITNKRSMVGTITRETKKGRPKKMPKDA